MSSSRPIFISYRRSDTTSESGRIYDRLVAEFGRDNIFKDIDNIPLGTDFAQHLAQAVSQCQIVLVIIGKDWVTVTEGDGTRRLDNPDDFVRIEVESALKREIPVIPVLLEGVDMPKRTELPASLHPLSGLNGITIGYDPRFHIDMNRLIKGLKGWMSPIKTIPEVTESPSKENQQSCFPKSPLLTCPFDIAMADIRKREFIQEQTTLQPIREVLSDDVSLDIAMVPGGTFLMGSREDEPGCKEQEFPKHKVTVPPFLMGCYPVTQAQWAAIAKLPKVKHNLALFPSRFKGDNLPVERISCVDAVEFCQRLARHTGRQYRLPSESEWEYACGAGTTTSFYFGETLTANMANFGATNDTTTEVGCYPGNDFRLHDMHGNVWEWCQDCWHDHYMGAPTDGSAWLTDGEGVARVLRGGSWYNDLRDCRTASRGYYISSYRHSYFGFRVCCSVPEFFR